MKRSDAGIAQGPTVEFKVHFRRGDQGRRRLRRGERKSAPPAEPGHVPRISRLLALAIHFEGLVHRGEVRDHADLARLGGVTRARISQIMGLLNLAPVIQEEILFLPRALGGRDVMTERQIRPIAGTSDWGEQLRRWTALRQTVPGSEREPVDRADLAGGRQPSEAATATMPQGARELPHRP
jgi:hypothetical protein